MDAVKSEVNGGGGAVTGTPLPQRQQKGPQGGNKPFIKNPAPDGAGGGPVEKKPRFAPGMQQGNQGPMGNNKPGFANKSFVNRNRNRGAANSPNKGNFQNMHNVVSSIE